MNEAHMISRRYLWGSDGDLNFFFRPKGEIFIYQMGDEELMYTQQDDEYIIQWGGSPLYDSGYNCETFETFAEGLKVWESDVARDLGTSYPVFNEGRKL